MKVLHLNNYDRKGGAETVFSITKEMNGVETYAGFVRTNPHDTTPDISFDSWEANSKLIGIFNYVFSFRNYRLLRDFLSKTEIDIIHLQGFFSSLSPSILLAIREAKEKKKIKVVQTLHDFHLVCPNSSLYNFNGNKICEKCVGKKIKFSIFLKNCDRRGYFYSVIKGVRSLVANNFLGHRNIVDKFICPSEFLKAKLLEDGIDEKKIVLIRNPIVLKNGEQPFRKQNTICFFGRFSKEKNIEFLIDTFSLWKEKTRNNYTLLLIGEGEEEKRLKFCAEKSRFKDSIIFKKYMPVEDLVDTIKTSKYFCMSSVWYENAPMAILDAVSLNIIPITPDIGGMNETINSFLHIGRTYKAGDKNSWMETIANLETNYSFALRNLVLKKRSILIHYGLKNYYMEILRTYSKSAE